MKKKIVEIVDKRPVLALAVSLTSLLIVVSVTFLAVLFVVLSGAVLGGIWIVSMDMSSDPLRLSLAFLPLVYGVLVGRSIMGLFEGETVPWTVQTDWGN